MKKILIFIVGILGIGVSFCSADGIYHNPDLGLISFIYNNSVLFTLSDKNVGATCTDISKSCSYGTYFDNNGKSSACSDGYFLFSRSYYSNDIFPSLFSYLNISDTDNLGKIDALNNYLLFPLAGWQSLSTSQIYLNGDMGQYLNSDYNSSLYFQKSNSTFSYNNGTSLGGRGWSVRCFKTVVVDPDYTWVVLTGDSLSLPSPKFKVNYGSTSYEYTLEDNLEIRLNSPVLKDGNNYSYDGSTGINLFYNGISQFYNKSELYLFTLSWYSANIFNPICL